MADPRWWRRGDHETPVAWPPVASVAVLGSLPAVARALGSLPAVASVLAQGSLPAVTSLPELFRQEVEGSARGSSIALSYVLTLAITAVLLSSLVFAAGSLVEERRETVAREELRVVGEHVTSRLMAADRLAATGPSSLVVRGRFPPRIAGRTYRLTVDTGGARSVVRLAVDTPSVVVEVPFVTRTPVVETTVNGGDLEVVLAGGSLEVRAG